MDQEAGVSGEGVQHAICTGQSYSGKDWSDEERHNACERYEELTGVRLSTPASPTPPSFDVIVAVIVVSVVLITSAYVLYRGNHMLKKKKSENSP